MGSASFRCCLTSTGVPLERHWEHTVGSCHAPLALRADWQDHLRRCRQELGFRHVRFHGLLSDDLGAYVTHEGQHICSFFNADRIVEFLLSVGMKPFVELSFMPEALASGAATIFHYRANVTPPKDYRGWAGLIRRLAGHWVDRFGAAEVRQWPFEVWNEPNLRAFWAGTQNDYFLLYRHTAEVVKEVDAGIRVGGPATARNEWVEEFLDYCARERLPADFVSTHHYPNDPLWSEAQDTEAELAGSRRGILSDWARETRARARAVPLYYTEWNISSNPRYARQDEPYAAAFVVKTVLDVNGLVDCYSFWTFSDLFEENYFPSVPFHGGFGLLTLHGVPKPTYRAFELLHRLGDKLLPVEGHHETVDAWVVRKGTSATILMTNHALPRQPIEAQRVRIELADLPSPRAATVERIDDEHANPQRAWIEMGQPEYLNGKQVEVLETASRLVKEPAAWKYDGSSAHFEIALPSHAVAAVTVDL